MNDTLLSLKRAANFMLDLVFPPKCIFCNTILTPGVTLQICPECYDKIPFVQGKVCETCGQVIDTAYGPEKCLDCRDVRHYFEKNISPCEYKGMMRDAMVRFKFFKKRWYAKTLGQLMLKKLRKMKNLPIFDIIVYTPLYKKRLSERGFNQAKLLAKVIAQELPCSLGENILLKIKDTQPQSKLTRSQRRKNIKDAFQISDETVVKGKTVLLVDDVYTTGTTVDECSKLLKRAGAKEVYVVTTAIGKGIY
ncbi:MAG: competence protein ComFC [Clostridiales bacterium]|jgi:ComF family protein|nr:competence protein ComFC [Clostridiales bacterium]MDK2934099.1 competence protein ComFC [Clostridiales bacterium]